MKVTKNIQKIFIVIVISKSKRCYKFNIIQIQNPGRNFDNINKQAGAELCQALAKLS
jgi:hypothetical protein